MKKNQEKEVDEARSNELQELNDKLVKAEADMEHWKNQYYQAYADMANLRKDIEKDHREAIKYRLEGFVGDLLPVLDAFDIALRNEASSPEMKNYLIGFQYVQNSLLSILENEGVTKIEPKVGDKFDVNIMHAVETVEDEGEENIVKEVTLKGYKLYDHLVRAAMVVVSKHPTPNDVKEEENDEKLEQKA